MPPVNAACDAAFYKWRRMEMPRKLKALKEGSRKFKRLPAESMLNASALKKMPERGQTGE